MIYEITEKLIRKNGKVAINRSFLTESLEFAKKDGQDAIRIIQEGRKRGTLIQIQYTEFDLEHHFESYKVVVYEATTGRRLYTFSNKK